MQIQDLKTARWVFEKFYITRSEVIERIEAGDWYLPDDKMYLLEDALSSSSANEDETLKRIMGDNIEGKFSIPEDDLVEIIEYWQSPGKGVGDAYAVMLGGIDGELVRYGENPYPYKNHPYIGKSFDPDEAGIDGEGICEQYRPIQEVVNNFLNMRIDDVRQNMITPAFLPEDYVDKQTLEDFQAGNKFIRLNKEAIDGAKSTNPNFDLRKEIFEIPVRTSTGELLVADLPFILSQGKETSNISDTFSGRAGPHSQTLGEIQEVLQRNQGVFRPIYLQLMRSFEEMGEIMHLYFKDPDFFPTERIIQIVGKNHYQETIDNWHNPGGNLFVRSVSADDMDVDVTVSAVSGADALASRTFLTQSIQQTLAAVGQIPGLAEMIGEEMDFAKIFELMVNVSGHDPEEIRLSPEEKQKKQQQKQQQKQQALQEQQRMAQMQLQLDAAKEQGRQNARAQSQIAIDSNKSQLDMQELMKTIPAENRVAIQQIVKRISAQRDADLVKMLTEFELEKQVPNVSVGHGNNVNQ